MKEGSDGGRPGTGRKACVKERKGWEGRTEGGKMRAKGGKRIGRDRRMRKDEAGEE